MNNDYEESGIPAELIIEFYADMLEQAMELNRKLLKDLTSYREDSIAHTKIFDLKNIIQEQTQSLLTCKLDDEAAEIRKNIDTLLMVYHYGLLDDVNLAT